VRGQRCGSQRDTRHGVGEWRLRRCRLCCEKDQLKLYYTEVLVPALDGALPTRETETAAAH